MRNQSRHTTTSRAMDQNYVYFYIERATGASRRHTGLANSQYVAREVGNVVGNFRPTSLYRVPIDSEITEFERWWHAEAAGTLQQARALIDAISRDEDFDFYFVDFDHETSVIMRCAEFPLIPFRLSLSNSDMVAFKSIADYRTVPHRIKPSRYDSDRGEGILNDAYVGNKRLTYAGFKALHRQCELIEGVVCNIDKKLQSVFVDLGGFVSSLYGWGLLRPYNQYRIGEAIRVYITKFCDDKEQVSTSETSCINGIELKTIDNPDKFELKPGDKREVLPIAIKQHPGGAVNIVVDYQGCLGRIYMPANMTRAEAAQKFTLGRRINLTMQRIDRNGCILWSHPDTITLVKHSINAFEAMVDTMQPIEATVYALHPQKSNIIVTARDSSICLHAKALLRPIADYKVGESIVIFALTTDAGKIAFSENQCIWDSPIPVDKNLSIQIGDIAEVVVVRVGSNRIGLRYGQYSGFLDASAGGDTTLLEELHPTQKLQLPLIRLSPKRELVWGLPGAASQSKEALPQASGMELDKLPVAFAPDNFFGPDPAEYPRVYDYQPPEAIVQPSVGDKCEARIIGLHIAGVLLDCGEWGVCVLPVQRLCATYDEFKQLRVGVKVNVVVKGVTRNNFVRLGNPDLRRPIEAGSIKTELTILWHYPTNALAMDSSGRFFSIPVSAISPKFGVKKFMPYASVMLKPALGTKFVAEIEFQQTSEDHLDYVCRVDSEPLDLDDTMYKQNVRGRVISREPDGDGINLVVDLGNRLGIVPLRHMCWRMSDEVDAKIANGEEFEFICLGYKDRKRPFLTLSRLLFDIGNIEMEKDKDKKYRGITLETGADGMVGVKLDNGYSMYFPKAEVGVMPELLSPHGDGAVLVGKTVHVRYIGCDLPNGRLIGTLK